MRSKDYGFDEFFARDIQLNMRALKVHSKFIILKVFYPWKALCSYWKFKRVMNKIHEMRVEHHKQGYYIRTYRGSNAQDNHCL